MNSYSTVPQEASVDEPVLNREVKLNMKTILGAAAFASFVIGSLAVVAVAPYQPSQAAVMAFSHTAAKDLDYGSVSLNGRCHLSSGGGDWFVGVTNLAAQKTCEYKFSACCEENHGARDIKACCEMRTRDKKQDEEAEDIPTDGAAVSAGNCLALACLLVASCFFPCL